jgi:hypothetical protein
LRQCLEEDPGAEAEQRVVYVAGFVLTVVGVLVGERELNRRRIPVVEAYGPVADIEIIPRSAIIGYVGVGYEGTPLVAPLLVEISAEDIGLELAYAVGER